jgi:hypothetical protein
LVISHQSDTLLHRLASVIAPDHQRVALGIGKAANPAQLFIRLDDV